MDPKRFENIQNNVQQCIKNFLTCSQFPPSLLNVHDFCTLNVWSDQHHETPWVPCCISKMKRDSSTELHHWIHRSHTTNGDHVQIKGHDLPSEYDQYTLPETNIEPLKIGRAPKGNSSSNHPFSGAMLVSGRVWSSNQDCMQDDIGWYWVEPLHDENGSSWWSKKCHPNLLRHFKKSWNAKTETNIIQVIILDKLHQTGQEDSTTSNHQMQKLWYTVYNIPI